MNILLIEDNPFDCKLTTTYLSETGGGLLSLETAERLSGGLEVLSKGDIDAVLLDLFLPDSEGIETFSRVHSSFPEVPVIVVTGLDDEALGIQAVRDGAQDYLRKKDLSGELLVRTLRYAVERNQAEEKLRRSEEYLRHLLDSVAEAIYEVDKDGVCTYCNPACLRVLGYTSPVQLIGKNMPLLVHHSRKDEVDGIPDDSTVRRTAQGGERVHIFDEMLYRADGSKFPGEYWANPISHATGSTGAVVTFIDLTERKRFEEQLRQAQKIEAIGRLAGGVAHDFNNLLGVVLANCDLLQESGPQSELAPRALERIVQGARSAASLTAQLLAFSRCQTLKPALLDLTVVINEARRLLAHLIPDDITQIIKATGDLGQVRADASQVQQIIVNLALHARTAMPHGGTLTIELQNEEIEHAISSNGSQFVPPGSYVTLKVSDTGNGMDAASQAHIFEPFYTTKSREPGLAMAIVHSIVKQAGGHIVVSSVLGSGSTFKVFLPRADEPAAKRILPTIPEEEPRFTETILVVEDETNIREVACSFLAECGYTMLAAASRAEAVALARMHRGAIDLLLADVALASGSGREVADELKTLRPEIAVAYMSGYSDKVAVHRGILDPGIVLLQKPFTRSELLGTVRETLDARKESPKVPGS
jgi:PAS domain S-box-containing protein